MILNYPLECWDVDTVSRSVVPYGRFLVWNKDMSNRARILVKIRAYNVDTLPMSIVVIKNLAEDGNSDSWTCPLVLLSSRMIGAAAGDEDPLPPNGANLHPLPLVDQGFWHDDHMMQDDEGNIGEEIAIPAMDNAAPPHAAPAADLAPPLAENVAPINDNVVQINPATPPLQANQPAADDEIIEIIQSVEPMFALRGLISSIIGNASEVLPHLGDSHITAANCKVVEANGPSGKVRTCYLQIDAVDKAGIRNRASSSVEITDISDDTVPDLNLAIEQPSTKRMKKGKGKLVTDVSQVRRSNRIAGLAVGYKDVKSAVLAEQSVKQNQQDASTSKTGNRAEGNIVINLAPQFEAEIINNESAPPPHLPASTIQAIGRNHCKMPSEMVSDAALNYDSSNDSV
jgi:hypothetical protein